MMRTIISITALVAPAQLLGQATGPVPVPAYYRALQIRELEVQRRLLLAMADSMPEPLYHDHATPVQRDFSSQIMHAAEGPSLVVSEYLHTPPPVLPDSTAAVNTRLGLRAYINASYDYARGLLEHESDQSRAELFRFWSGAMIPRWQMWDEIHQHTIWTAGQVVANFRKHGMAPPGFGFF